MKKLIVYITLAIAANAACAEPKLMGKWKSDGAKTISFAKARAKLEDKTLLFLEQLMGHMTLTFSRDKLATDMPDVEIESGEGVKSKFEGFSERYGYKVLGSTESQVVILSIEPVTRRKVITVFNFEGDDTMWTYVAGPSMPDANFREYFVRQPRP